MGFDFLPDINNEQQEQKQQKERVKTSQSLSSADHVFFDNYKNHISLHNIRSVPPKISEFNQKNNFNIFENSFSENNIRYSINEGKQWFGENTDYQKLVDGYVMFQKPELLNKVAEKVKDALPDDLFSQIPKKKIRFNDRGFGLFSFDKAISGLQLAYEYFDSEGEKVDSNFVEKRNDKFYFITTGQEVSQKRKLTDKGLPQASSIIKDSYIDFEEKSVMSNAVEIFVLCSVSGNTEVNQFVYNSVAASVVGKMLTEKGFKTKINIVVGTFLRNHKKYVHHIIPVKRWEDTFDQNAVAYVGGDPRFFRFDGFKAIIAGCDNLNLDCPPGLGRIIKEPLELKYFFETFYFPKTEKPVAKTNLFMGGSRSLQESIGEIENMAELLIKEFKK